MALGKIKQRLHLLALPMLVSLLTWVTLFEVWDLDNDYVLYKRDFNTKTATIVHVVYFKPQGSCPERACAVTPLSLFGTEIAVESQVAMTVHELPLVTNLLIVTRGPENVLEVGRHLEELRQHNATNHAMLIGLLEMADEQNVIGNARYYGLFDYVIRNYYFHSLLGAPSSMYLRALGNWTCGTSKAEYENWPSISRGDDKRSILYQENQEPWLGVHWITNEEGPPQSLSKLLPSSKRNIDCNFVGSMRSHRPEMVSVFRNSSCLIQVESQFGGNIPHDQYVREFVAQTKITLAPWGNSHETIRVAEALNYSSIPLIITNTGNPHEYLNKFFRPIPALYADSWVEARKLIDDVLRKWDSKRLDEMQVEVVKWKKEYQECKWSDMYRIMSYGIASDGAVQQ